MAFLTVSQRGFASAGLRGCRRLMQQSTAAANNFPAYVLNAPATEVTTLPNGVRVASEVGLRGVRP